MALQYAEQVTVRVWRNVKRYGKLPTSHFGHASVELRSPSLPAGRVHLSFWPGERAGLGLSALRKQPGGFTEGPAADRLSEMNRLTALRLEVGYRKAHSIPYPKVWDGALRQVGRGPLVARPGQKRLGTLELASENPSLPIDFPQWAQSQDRKFKLPGLGVSGCFWGLSLSQMRKWWSGFETSEPTYQALSFQNCAGVALMALRAGGADAFAPMPHVHVYAEPAQVERYAALLELKLKDMEDCAAALRRDANSAGVAGGLSDLHDGLWTVGEWKRQSALGLLQSRSPAIRAIDEALALYHSLSWSGAYARKYHALAQVFRGVVAHRQQKADSARSAAVLRLGVQILFLLTSRGPHYG